MAGISISYDRVREIEDILGNNVCEQFSQENIVCPRDLRKNLYTVGALDNIDHDPSTSAEGSFYGTSISIIVSHPSKFRQETNSSFQTWMFSRKKYKLPDYIKLSLFLRLIFLIIFMQ